MKIVLIGSYPPPHGGQAVHIAGLKKFLEAQGYQCMILNTGKNKDINEKGIMNINRTWNLFMPLLYQSNSIMHVHISDYLVYQKIVPVYVISVMTGRKFIVTFHSGKIEDSIREIGFFGQNLMRAMLKRANRIICVNKHIIEVLSLEGIDPSKCRVIPDFALDSDLRGVSLPPETENFLNKRSPIISCCGFFTPVYGFDLAIQALDQVKDEYANCALMIMGTGDKQEDYLKMVSRMNLEQFILFVGNLEHKQSLAVMRRSDIFIRPTLFDGDAISVREALALKTPVIASDTEHRPDGVALFEVGNADALREKMVAVLKSGRGIVEKPTHVLDLTNFEKIYDTYDEILEP